jgi:hypothetical protein
MQQQSALSHGARAIESLASGESRMSGARRSRSILWLLVAAIWLAVAMNVAAVSDEIFAKVCAEREVKVITLIEDHAAAAFIEPLVDNEALGRAGLMLIEARQECYSGRVAKAVALYDKIVTMLGPVAAWQTR